MAVRGDYLGIASNEAALKMLKKNGPTGWCQHRVAACRACGRAGRCGFLNGVYWVTSVLVRGRVGGGFLQRSSTSRTCFKRLIVVTRRKIEPSLSLHMRCII